MALMMPNRHVIDTSVPWQVLGGGTNRMPLCYMPLLFVPVAAPDDIREPKTKQPESQSANGSREAPPQSMTDWTSANADSSV